MTQVELANKSGFDQTYISLIERGLRAPRDPDTKKRLAKALGIAPSRLRFSEPQPRKSIQPTSDTFGHTLHSRAGGAGQ
jgi:transcriptional regulator with XRE-family HTH domain